MAYVPKPDFGTKFKVLKVIPLCNGSANIALNNLEKQSNSLSDELILFRRVAFRGGN